MKRFILKTCLFAAAFAGIVSAGTFVLPKNPHSYMAEFARKQNRLREENSRKIVFVGGSNLAFGLDSEAIQRELKIPVLNDALHAGIGLYFIAETTCPHLKKGDFAIFAFEYQHFFGEAGGMKEFVNALIYDSSVLQNLSFETLARIPAYLPEVSYDNAKNCAKFLLKKDWEKPGAPYSLESFNKFGDVVGHLKMEPKTIRASSCVSALDAEAVDFFCAKLTELKNRGVHVFVFPPVLQKSSYKNWEKNISQLRAELRKRGFDFCVCPSRYAFADNLFFDTFYHSNAQGIKLRTELIIDDLKNVCELPET